MPRASTRCAWLLPVALAGLGGCDPSQSGQAMPFLQALFQGFARSGQGQLQQPGMGIQNFQSVPSGTAPAASAAPATSPPPSPAPPPADLLGQPGAGDAGLTTTGDPGVAEAGGLRLLLEGEASWYGDTEHGGETSTGETMDRNALTAAIVGTRTPYMVRVVRTDTGESVDVRVNDAGPFAVDSKGKAIFPLRRHPTRVIDLSQAAFRRLGDTRAGVIPVKVYAL